MPFQVFSIVCLGCQPRVVPRLVSIELDPSVTLTQKRREPIKLNGSLVVAVLRQNDFVFHEQVTNTGRHLICQRGSGLYDRHHFWIETINIHCKRCHGASFFFSNAALLARLVPQFYLRYSNCVKHLFVYMNKQLLEQHLALLGLDETEIKIYLGLFASGPQTPLELSRKSGVNRSKIYRYLERLKNRKLVEDVDSGWGLKIRVAGARNLELMIKERESDLEEQKEVLPLVLTELKALEPKLSEEFQIKSYHGLEGLKQMMWNQLSGKGEILQFTFETRNEVVGKSFAEKVREEQVLRGLKLYEIENAKDQGKYWYTRVAGFPQYYESRHIPSKVLDIQQNTAIFNDTVSIMNWVGENKAGLEIVNPAFAKMQREIFWKFWELAGKSLGRNSGKSGRNSGNRIP